MATTKERRDAARSKSFLQGRIYYNNRRSSVDCLIRDYSETGAKLKFAESAAVPEAMELYIPNRETMHRARVQWRTGNEMGVVFGDAARDPSASSDSTHVDLAQRMQRLEVEIASLRRIVNELRAAKRKPRDEVA